MLSKLFKKFFTREIIVYVLVGGMTTVVNWLVSYLFNNILQCESSVVTNSVAWVAAVAFAYVTNNTWVFQIGFEGWKKELSKIGKFTASRIATGVIEIGGMFLLDDIMGLPYWPVKIVISVAVIVLNYVFSKVFVFIKSRKNNDGTAGTDDGTAGTDDAAAGTDEGLTAREEDNEQG